MPVDVDSGKSRRVAGPGLIPLYLSDSSLDRWAMKKGAGSRVTDMVEFKVLKKNEVKKEIEENGENSEFHQIKQQLEEYEGDDLLLVRGPENEFEYNYLWCSTLDSFEDHMQEMKERQEANRRTGSAIKDGHRRGGSMTDLMGEDDGVGGVGGGGDDGDDDGDGEGHRHGSRSRSSKLGGSRFGAAGGFGGDDGGEKATVKRPVETMTDIEIATFKVKNHRPPLGFYISQSRFKFGKPIDFDDVEPGEKSSEYRRHKVVGYTESRRVLERGFQAAPIKTDMSVQTAWRNAVNKATQYAPVTLSESERNTILQSDALKSFLKRVEGDVVHELQKNETLDLFYDLFEEFEDEEVSLGNRLENSLEVFHSFAHYKWSKGKNINAVQWMPIPTTANAAANAAAAAASKSKGKDSSTAAAAAAAAAASRSLVSTTSSFSSNTPYVAFSCSNNVTFDQWVDQSGKVLSSTILIYTLSDVLHPFLVLDVPGNITTFRVHPTMPEYVAAGLMTGQVIFWDLSDAREKVRLYQMQQRVNQHAYNRGGAAASKDATGGSSSKAGGSAGAGSSGAPGAGASTGETASSTDGSTESSDDMPTIKYTILSYIDRSHSRPVTDIIWVPPHQQVNRKGEFYTADRGISSQFMSVAADGKVLIWDFIHKNDGSGSKAAAAAAAAAMGGAGGGGGGSLAAKVAQQSEDLDAKEPKWSPIFTLPLYKPDTNAQGGGGSGGGPNATTNQLSALKLTLGEGSVLMTVSEDGEVSELDWHARTSEEKPRAEIVKRVRSAHFQACSGVERSPHFQDIYLTVGDWTFSIWKVGFEQPVFTSCCASDYLTAAKWSPTRPGIIITAKADGTIDVWDLVDQCHKPSLNFQTGFTDQLSCIEFWQSKNSSHQYLACGDTGGKLHIIEIPRNLRRRLLNEDSLLRLFYEREIARVRYSLKRTAERKASEAAAQASKNKGVSAAALAAAAAAAGEDPNAFGNTTTALPSPSAVNGSNNGTASNGGNNNGSTSSSSSNNATNGEKLSDAQQKEKEAERLEEERLEKEFQKLFDNFKLTLAPEDMNEELAAAINAIPPAGGMRR